jgi:anthranilate phosphoribosyltransferase
VVHADDGLDELSTLGPTRISELKNGHISTWKLDPASLGIEYARLSDLHASGVDDAAAAITEVLDGKRGPRRDIVLLNAAAAMVVAERVGDLSAGLKAAADAVDSGQARRTLEMLVRVTQAG